MTVLAISRVYRSEQSAGPIHTLPTLHPWPLRRALGKVFGSMSIAQVLPLQSTPWRWPIQLFWRLMLLTKWPKKLDSTGSNSSTLGALSSWFCKAHFGSCQDMIACS